MKQLTWKGLWNSVARKLAYCMPKRIVYWCSMRLAAHATMGKYETQIVPELTVMEALERWPV